MSPVSHQTKSSNNNIAGSEDALLAVSGIGFDYENAPIVDGVRFSVYRGEFVALVGPSGCGKSTLLNLISGVLEAREGSINTNGLIGRTERLGNVSYMQQKDLLLPWRTVAENSRLGLELNGVGKAESIERVGKLAGLFGIADVLDHMPWQLSGGMRQRVALLRAVMPDNPVLLLDEPFGALDAITRRSLQQWLLNVLDTANKAVVLVTHDVDEAILLADRILVMAPDPGRIIADIKVNVEAGTEATDISMSPEFNQIRASILDLLSHQECVR